MPSVFLCAAMLAATHAAVNATLPSTQRLHAPDGAGWAVGCANCRRVGGKTSGDCSPLHCALSRSLRFACWPPPSATSNGRPHLRAVEFEPGVDLLHGECGPTRLFVADMPELEWLHEGLTESEEGLCWQPGPMQKDRWVEHDVKLEVARHSLPNFGKQNGLSIK